MGRELGTALVGDGRPFRKDLEMASPAARGVSRRGAHPGSLCVLIPAAQTRALADEIWDADAALPRI